MNRQVWILACGFALVACHGSSGGRPDGGNVGTVLSGTLYEALQDRAHGIAIYDRRGGTRGDQLASTRSDSQGRWSVNLGALFGDFEVEVEEERSSGLRAIIDGVELGEARANIQITPVTELVSSYTAYLQRTGLDPKNALAKAHRLIEGHFGHIERDTQPARLDRSLVEVSAESTSAVLLFGFDELARQIAERSGLLPDGLVSRRSLVQALSADIGADGVFDGRGDNGRLRLGAVDLDGDTLRADYGRAILAWLEGPRNPTGLSRMDFETLLRSIATDGSEIFPPGTPKPLDEEGPRITWFAIHSDLRLLSGLEPSKGDLTVELGALAVAGEASIDLVVEDAPQDVLEMIEQRGGYKTWRVHGTRLADGQHVLRAEARDPWARKTTARRAFVTDNTPPVLTATTAAIVASPTVRIRGTVRDAIGPVERIDVEGGGGRASVPYPQETYEATVMVACNAVWPISVVAYDAAGNAARTTLTVRCDSTPPSIGWDPSPFQSESTLDALYSADGRAISYAFRSGRSEIVRLDTTSTATIAKYFNRLDAGADNLPTFRFHAHDEEGRVRAEYRYLVNGQERRTWSALLPRTTGPAQNEYELQVSYQAFGTELWRSAPRDIHRLEIRAVDDAGNARALSAQFRLRLRSPPVWFGNCRLDPGLTAYTLPANSLDAIYRQAAVGALKGSYRYIPGLPSQSLAPREGVFVRLSPGDGQSRIIGLSEDRHDGPTPMLTLGEWCYPHPTRGSTRIGPDAQHLSSCTIPATPVDQVVLALGPGASVNDLETHALLARALDPAGAPLPRLGADELITAPNVEHTVEVALDHPQIRIGGVGYTWPTTFSVPMDYALRSGPPRYRVPQRNRVGFNSVDEPPLYFGRTYAFVTRAYISAFEIDIAPVLMTARHQTIPNVPIEVQVAPECSRPLAYVTRL